MNGLELVHGNHAREFKCVVLVRFSFDVGPSPGFLAGGADEGFQAKRHREVIDPARRATGLHVSKKQHMVLNLPRSSARIFMFAIRSVW